MVLRLVLSLFIASDAALVPGMRAQLIVPGGNQPEPKGTTPCGARVAATASAGQLFVSTSKAFLIDRDKRKAASGYLKVTQLDPKYAPAWFNLGVLAEGNQKWVEATGYFDKYLQVAPYGPEAKRAAEEMAILAPYAAGRVSPAEAIRVEYDASISRARILMAAKLYREGYAPKLWLTHSAEPGATLKAMEITFISEDAYNLQVLMHEGVPADAIRVLQPPIVNTADEIIAVSAALREEKGARVAPQTIYQRVAYAHSVIDGRTAI